MDLHFFSARLKNDLGSWQPSLQLHAEHCWLEAVLWHIQMCAECNKVTHVTRVRHSACVKCVTRVTL